MNTAEKTRPRSVRHRTHLGAATALILALVLAACAGTPDEAGDAARGFAAALAGGEIDAAAAHTDAPGDAATTLTADLAGLQAEDLQIDIGTVRTRGDTATAEATYRWSLPRERDWEYTTEWDLGRSGGEWTVRWNDTVIHPELGGGQTMELRTWDPPRAPVIGSDGAELLEPGLSALVLFDAAKADSPRRSADRVVEALAEIRPDLRAQTLVEYATGVDGYYSVARISGEEAEEIGPRLDTVPGVLVSDQPDLLPTHPDLSNQVIGQIKDASQGLVDGRPGWRVVSVNRDGVDVAVLTETEAAPASAVQVGLDRAVQIAAQQAVGFTDRPTMIVAVRPSTGEILAIAQNEKADEDGAIALHGLYPPGSTFKIVTASAALEEGLVETGSMVACPGETVIGQRTVPNYGGFALGTVPMVQAFAASCNTTFAQLAADMDADALTDAAADFGLGVDLEVPGLKVATGSVPPAEDLVQRAEDGFGQGRVVTSPLGMALTAATVAAGRLEAPRLLPGDGAQLPSRVHPLDPGVAESLRTMMREVVVSGTGSSIADQGEVFGKTGEAEFDGGSHSWFAGYRGDLAFATLIVGGGGSDAAVAVTRQMLAGLPDGHLTD